MAAPLAQHPAAYHPDTRMPHYRMDDKQVALLASFLLAKEDNDLLANVHLAPSNADSVAHGKKLVVVRQIMLHARSKHHLRQRPAADASEVRSKVLRRIHAIDLVARGTAALRNIAARIHDPRSFGAGLKMPKFTLSDAQTDALATALLAETDRAATYPKELIISCTRSSNYHPGGDAGKLMDDLRCLSCHAINGNSGDMAPLRHIAGLASDEARDAHWNTVC